MRRHTLAEHAMSCVALMIRVVFATLAAKQLVGSHLALRTAVVAILIAIATGAAVRVDRALQ